MIPLGPFEHFSCSFEGFVVRQVSLDFFPPLPRMEVDVLPWRGSILDPVLCGALLLFMSPFWTVFWPWCADGFPGIPSHA